MGSVITSLGLSNSEFHLFLLAVLRVFQQTQVLSKLTRSATLSQAISAKLEDGNVKAAIRLLMSADSPAETSQKSLNALREKHPPPGF